jgi:hypothetical protein
MRDFMQQRENNRKKFICQKKDEGIDGKTQLMG